MKKQPWHIWVNKDNNSLWPPYHSEKEAKEAAVTKGYKEGEYKIGNEDDRVKWLIETMKK